MAWINRMALRVATRKVREDEGQSMAEYGLILAGVAVVVMVAVLALGDAINGAFESVTGSIGGG